MSVVNVNSWLYGEIKSAAVANFNKIGTQAAQWLLIGKYFSENPTLSFHEINSIVRERAKDLQITG